MTNTWHIPSRARQCVAKSENLNEQTHYFSLLEKDASNNFLRYDFCPICWEEKKQTLPKNSIYWKANIFSIKTEKPTDHLTKTLDKLTEMLKEPKHQTDAFLLALYLTRSGLLIQRGHIEEDLQTLALFEIKQTSEMLCIPKPSLDILSQAIEKMPNSSPLIDLMQLGKKKDSNG